MTKNYYYILGINSNASSEEIKKAFRKLSHKFHPDKNDGDKFFEERFKEIQEAYETLIDDEKRRLYDISNIRDKAANEPFYVNFEEEIKSEYGKIRQEKEKLKKEKEDFEKEKHYYKNENEKKNSQKSDEGNISKSPSNLRLRKNYLSYSLIGIFTILILIFFINIIANRKHINNIPMIPESKIYSSEKGSIENEIDKDDDDIIKTEQMILVEGGEFEMGSNTNFHDERPKHIVVLKSFYIDNEMV